MKNSPRTIRTATPERAVNLTALLFAGLFVAVVFGLSALWTVVAQIITHHAL
jgi:hypothetical protein